MSFQRGSDRSEYDRRRNLDLICRALSGRWPSLDVGVSTREDLVLDGSLKVSGTAAKLGGRSASHHCTLLVAADAPHLRRALKAPHVSSAQPNSVTRWPS